MSIISVQEIMYTILNILYTIQKLMYTIQKTLYTKCTFDASSYYNFLYQVNVSV